MRIIFGRLEIDLQLFNGAAGGAGAGGEGAAGGDGAAQAVGSALPKADINRRGGSSRRSGPGAYDNVVFGKQGDDSAAGADVNPSPAAGDNAEGSGKSGITTTSDTLEAKRAKFQEMIDGEYKDQYAETFQKAFNRRFSEVKSLEQTIAAQKPILDMLAQRYNIEDGDMGKLQKAIEEDSSYWSQAAEEAGLTEEQYKAMQKLKRESAELAAMKLQQQGEQQAQAQLARWQSEADAVKAIYPGFDFRTELANREFQGLLKSGIPVQKAYELIHMDEIMAARQQATAQTTAAQMQAKIKSRAARPNENGTSSQSAVIVKNDVSSLSRADRAEIARRAQRGEQIKF